MEGCLISYILDREKKEGKASLSNHRISSSPVSACEISSSSHMIGSHSRNDCCLLKSLSSPGNKEAAGKFLRPATSALP